MIFFSLILNSLYTNMYILSSIWAWQLCYTEILLLPGHTMTFAVLRYTINGCSVYWGMSYNSGIPCRILFVFKQLSINAVCNFSLSDRWITYFNMSDRWPAVFVCLTGEATITDTCAVGATACHSKANCVDYQSGGFCCICQRGYYGNGFNCLKEGINFTFYIIINRKY